MVRGSVSSGQAVAMQHGVRLFVAALPFSPNDMHDRPQLSGTVPNPARRVTVQSQISKMRSPTGVGYPIALIRLDET